MGLCKKRPARLVPRDRSRSVITGKSATSLRGPLAAPADEADAVSVRVVYIHLTVAPSLVRRGEPDRNPLGDEFGVECVHVRHEQEDRAAHDRIPGEG